MPEERLSDLTVIAKYYSERFEVDEINMPSLCKGLSKKAPVKSLLEQRELATKKQTALPLLGMG